MSQSILIHHLHTHKLYVTNAKVVHKHGYSIRSMQVVRGHWARQAAAAAAATGPQHDIRTYYTISRPDTMEIALEISRRAVSCPKNAMGAAN